MLIPHRNLLIAAGLWLGCAAVAIVLPPALTAWQLGGALLLVVALTDAWAARELVLCARAPADALPVHARALLEHLATG